MTWQQTIDEEKRFAFEEGHDAGVMEGTEQAIRENARNFLRMNLGTPEQIAQGTGLSLEKVLTLQKELSYFSLLCARRCRRKHCMPMAGGAFAVDAPCMHFLLTRHVDLRSWQQRFAATARTPFSYHAAHDLRYAPLPP